MDNKDKIIIPMCRFAGYTFYKYQMAFYNHIMKGKSMNLDKVFADPDGKKTLSAYKDFAEEILGIITLYEDKDRKDILGDLNLALYDLDAKLSPLGNSTLYNHNDD